MKIIKAGRYKANQAWPVGFDFCCHNYYCQCVFRVEEGDDYKVQLADHRKSVPIRCPECGNTHLYDAPPGITPAYKTVVLDEKVTDETRSCVRFRDR